MNLFPLVATICLATMSFAAQAADQPNILRVMADDMGLDASTCNAVGNQ